jgi:hypothetical protein
MLDGNPPLGVSVQAGYDSTIRSVAEDMLRNVALRHSPRLGPQVVDELLWIETDVVLSGGDFKYAGHSYDLTTNDSCWGLKSTMSRKLLHASQLIGHHPSPVRPLPSLAVLRRLSA